jgi:hypothetical protein
MATIEARLRRLEALRSTGDYCQCDSSLRVIDYRRSLPEVDGLDATEPEVCPRCGKVYDDIRVVAYDMTDGENCPQRLFLGP